MFGWLLGKRKRSPPVPMPAPALPAAPVRRTNGGEDLDLSNVDFDAFSELADTAAFLDWHYGRFPDARGLDWSQLWTRYQVYCVEHRVAPLSPAALRVQMGKAGVRKKRIMKRGGKRVTVYDIVGRTHLVRAVA